MFVARITDYQLASLFIRFVSTVNDLVTLGVNINTLSIVTGELIFSASRQLDCLIIREAFVTTYGIKVRKESTKLTNKSQHFIGYSLVYTTTNPK